MKALEVLINGKRLCVASVGDAGALHAIVSWVGGPEREEETLLDVGGFDSANEEHTYWSKVPLGVGAEVVVRVIETETADQPEQRHRFEMPETIGQYREALGEYCERLSESERRQLIQELVADLEGGIA